MPWHYRIAVFHGCPTDGSRYPQLLRPGCPESLKAATVDYAARLGRLPVGLLRLGLYESGS